MFIIRKRLHRVKVSCAIHPFLFTDPIAFFELKEGDLWYYKER